jgi:hypothetical protein
MLISIKVVFSLANLVEQKKVNSRNLHPGVSENFALSRAIKRIYDVWNSGGL